ncbi:hypothetical protein IWW52_002839, partial [Coemansia sp. RSA 2704]
CDPRPPHDTNAEHRLFGAMDQRPGADLGARHQPQRLRPAAGRLLARPSDHQARALSRAAGRKAARVGKARRKAAAPRPDCRPDCRGQARAGEQAAARVAGPDRQLVGAGRQKKRGAGGAGDQERRRVGRHCRCARQAAADECEAQLPGRLAGVGGRGHGGRPGSRQETCLAAGEKVHRRQASPAAPI